jgi:hypothetical protein
LAKKLNAKHGYYYHFTQVAGFANVKIHVMIPVPAIASSKDRAIAAATPLNSAIAPSILHYLQHTVLACSFLFTNIVYLLSAQKPL